MRQVLAAWGRPEVVGPLGGGNRNTVLELRLDGQRLVARQSRRSPASLDWEVDLLDHLARNGLHELTADWPQRPGFAATRDLLSTDRGGDVDLTQMPAGAVADCRRAWARL